MSCHDTTPAHLTQLATTGPRVVLVGNPNAGKSTLFNAATGAHQRTMNAPGTTVHWEVGTWKLSETTTISLIDLPGTQSLIPISPDEHVTAEAITGSIGARPELAIVTINATALESGLYLLAQVATTGLPVVVALTMTDVASSRGIDIPHQALAAQLGVPVIPVDPRRRESLTDLVQAIREAIQQPPHLQLNTPPLPETTPLESHLRDHADAHFEWVSQISAPLHRDITPSLTWSDRIDRVLLNPWAGVPVFLVVMWGVLQLTTSVAAPLQDALDLAIGGWLGDGVTWLLSLINLDTTWVRGLLVDGVIAGIATVATFIPPMAIMFAALAILEDSGYIARAGFVMDRIMRTLGLDGRAFLPLIIGFGCNLPALAATRTLPNARQRLLTGLLIPLSSCTARLTVFLVIGNIFFGSQAGTAVFLMYVCSVVFIILGGLLLRRTFFRDVRPEPFVIALPAYQLPRLGTTARSVILRTKDFLMRAGRVITATLVLMWVLMAIPLPGGSFGNVPVADSLYGRASVAIAPVFTPAGFGDWHASSALVTGFFAKEVAVGSLAQSYAVAEPTDPSQPGDLSAQLQATFTMTSHGHPSAAAAAFMVFMLVYTPCAATIAEQRRHFGWRPTLYAAGGTLGFAWVLAVLVFQIGRLL